uniref:Uncharacterized protein n=1 Tax=Vicia faba TaxID=3906 RepID=R4ITU7_VICFA|nr:hypothetical protein [Vicia faba]
MEPSSKIFSLVWKKLGRLRAHQALTRVIPLYPLLIKVYTAKLNKMKFGGCGHTCANSGNLPSLLQKKARFYSRRCWKRPGTGVRSQGGPPPRRRPNKPPPPLWKGPQKWRPMRRPPGAPKPVARG